MNKNYLKNKNILISGGCGHIGQVITKFYADNECNVYVLGTSLKKFNKIFKNTKNIFFIKHDYNIDKNLDKKIKSLDIQKIDVLINNAYFLKSSAPLENNIDDFVFSLKGTVGIYYQTIKACYPLLKDGSKIINIGSMYGNIIPDFKMYENENSINPIEYGIGKAGVSHLTKYLGNYLAKDNINVNCVLPGAIPSREAKKDKKLMNEIKKRTPLNRLGKPEDLLGILFVLSTDYGNFITGQCLTIDGGFSNKK